MNNYVEKAKEIATEAHKGQNRWSTEKGKSGDPYITHPAAVVEKVKVFGPDYEATAWLHDVLEDCEGYTEQLLLDRGIPENIVNSVVLLTKIDDIPYLDYLLKLSDDKVALYVKLADIDHNLSTSHPVKNKTLRQKWFMAQYILTESIKKKEVKQILQNIVLENDLVKATGGAWAEQACHRTKQFVKSALIILQNEIVYYSTCKEGDV